MSYSLGDDRESFDVYENTIKTLNLLGEKLIKNGWAFDKTNSTFIKGDRHLSFETSQDHICNLYIYDSLVDWDRFCNKYSMYETCDLSDDELCAVRYVSSNTDINKIVGELENAPLLEKNINI